MNLMLDYVMLLNITNEGFMFHAIACSTQKVICENLDRLFIIWTGYICASP
jgi:hypothetical protein